MTMDRKAKKQIRLEVLSLLDEKCRGCKIRAEIAATARREKEDPDTRSQQYCLTRCDVGMRLKVLGDKLLNKSKGLVV